MSESDESIELEEFLRFKGQVESQAQARQLIRFGMVRVNGWIEMQPRRGLVNGDTVVIGYKTFAVDLSEPREFVKLKQFLVWRRLARTPSQAEHLIRGGAVRVNGQVETRRVRKLFHGFTVTVGDKALTVDLSQPYTFIRLDHFLHRQGIFKVAKIVRANAVRVNGQVELNAKRRLFSGDVVTIAEPPEGDTVVGARKFRVDLSEEAAGPFDED